MTAIVAILALVIIVTPFTAQTKVKETPNGCRQVSITLWFDQIKTFEATLCGDKTVEHLDKTIEAH